MKNYNLEEAEIWTNDSCVFENDSTITEEELLEGDIYDEYE